MPRLLLAIVAILFLNVVAQAQTSNRPEYKLLWKISGKGLKKPSYLFGTMHVRDERAFDFSDSVLLKLEECQAFAMEVHPDSALKHSFTKAIDSRKSSEKLEKLMTPAEYKKLDSLFKARTGSSLKKFDSPRELRQHFREKVQSNDRNTFLDAWLYNLANQQNKKIMGLESYSTQAELLDRNPKIQLDKVKSDLDLDQTLLKDYYKTMLDVYHSGDINAIYRLSKVGANYEEMITKRNELMVAEIKKAIHEQSTFIAVGAAHLPGEEGLIYLLQKAGYTVTAVKPVFTGLAARYKYTGIEKQWVDFTSAEGGYVVSYPGKPMPFTPKTVPVVFNAYMDIGDPKMFMVAHIPLDAGVKTSTPASTFDWMISNLKDKFKISNSRNIKVSGLPAREFEIEQGDQVFVVRLVLRESLLYMLMAGPSKEAAHSDDAKKFLNSLKPIALPPLVKQNYVNAEGAFSVNMTGKVLEQTVNSEEETSGKEIKVKLFLTVNTESGETFIVRYNDMIPGYVSEDDSTYLTESVTSVLDASEGKDLKTEDVIIEGFPGLKYSFVSADKSVLTEGFVLMRGNRFYLCIAARTAQTSAEATEAFLSSFKLLPYKQTPTKTVSFPEGMSLKVPEKFELDSAIAYSGDVKQYSWLDTNSGMMFLLQIENLGAYDETKNAEGYFNLIKENLEDAVDSVSASQPVYSGKITGHDFWLNSKPVNFKKRIKYLISGRQAISLWGFLPVDHEQSNLPKESFDSFTVTPQSTWNLFEDKTELLLRNIFSTDTTTQAEAAAAIYGHAFETVDLPKVYEALERTFKTRDEFNLQIRLLNVLDDVHDQTTPAFVERIYTQLPDSTNARNIALGVFSSMQTEQETKTMMKLFREDKTSFEFYDYSLLGNYFDSLQLIAPWIPELMDQHKRFGSAHTLFDLVKSCYDSGAFQPDAQERVMQKLMTIAKEVVREPLPAKSLDDFYNKHTLLINVCQALTALKLTPEVKTLLMEFHKLNDAEIRLTTAMHFMQNEVKLPASDFELIAKDPLFRLELYDLLKGIGQEKLINKKYLTPVMIAESDLYEVIASDDEVPDETVFVSERKVMYQGKKQSLFVFKYKYVYDGVEEWATAVCGPYDKTKGAAIARGEYTMPLYDLYEGKELDEELKLWGEGEGGFTLLK